MLNERELYAEEEKWGISTVEADRHSCLSGERVLCQQESEFFRVLCRKFLQHIVGVGFE